MTSVVAGDSLAKCVRHNRADLLKDEVSYQVSHQVSYQVSYQGIASAMPKVFESRRPFRGCPPLKYRPIAQPLWGRVPSKMRHHALNWGCVGGISAAGLGEVPSSYRCYFGNRGFFWRIFRDITPIAARQALGWEFRGFLALV